MTETRYYLVLCPDNYYALAIVLVPLGAGDIDGFPCPNTEHVAHQVTRIGEADYNRRINIGAPNLGQRVATRSGDNGFSVDTSDIFDPTNYPPPQDLLPVTGVLSDYNERPEPPQEVDQTVIGNVAPEISETDLRSHDNGLAP